MEDLCSLVRINEDIAKTLGVHISGIYCVMDKDLSLYLNGTVQRDKAPRKGERMIINADIMDEYGRVLRSFSSYSTEKLLSSFTSFSIFCASVNRFFDPKKIKTIKIYPVLYAKE